MAEKQDNAELSTLDRALVKALHQIMRPLIKLMIHKNITLKHFIDILKTLYVEVAEESLQKESDRVTDSQISLMTGVHRKDVRKLRDEAIRREATPRPMSLGAHILSKWTGDSKYIDSEGNPVALSYQKTEETPDLNFVGLAESVSLDIRPRAILDDFIRLGVVSYDEKSKLVTLRMRAFVPQEDWEEKLYFLGKNNGDHIAASVHNVMGLKPRFFDRSVYYDGLTQESAETLRGVSSDAAMETLQMLNKKASDLAEKDEGKPDAHWRINFGSYFFNIEHDKESK